MSSCTTISVPRFHNEALNVIFGEVQRMAEWGDKYIGVVFENGRDKIGVSYAWSRSAFNSQSQRYPESLWTDISLAMCLIGRIAHREGLPELIRWPEGANSNATCWQMYPKEIGDNALSTLHIIFEEVDEVIKKLDVPRDRSPIN